MHETAPLGLGTKLPHIKKTITQEMIDRWADVSGDRNPLHVDPEFAKTTRFGGTIAHGHLSLAYLSEVLTRFFGRRWMEGGKLAEVRFIAPIRPGDEITVRGEVMEVEETSEGTRIRCDVWVENQGRETCVIGKAESMLSRPGGSNKK